MHTSHPDIEHAMHTTLRGATQLLVQHEWADKLKKSQLENTPLRIKLGLDPTAPDIHLGHTVVMNKLRQLQDLGHHVMFLIGDFTAQIGDPSGRNSTRPPLTPDEIAHNAQTYYAQAMRILNEEKTQVCYNSTWLNDLGAQGMIRLSSHYTVARMLEREDFTQRYAQQTPIAIHEFLYPLMQGYDSVALKADLEIGGTDQTFNLLMGRELQKAYQQSPQCILTMPLLEGLDGVQKMSKSKGNYIGIQEEPNTMFAKIMRVSDTLMWRYYELLSFETMDAIARYKKAVDDGENPRTIKVALAREIVTRFHSAAQAQAALDDFMLRAQGGVPENIPEIELNIPHTGVLITHLLREVQLVSSGSEAQRMITQGGVRLNQEPISDARTLVMPGTHIMQVGKRKFIRAHLSVQDDKHANV